MTLFRSKRVYALLPIPFFSIKKHLIVMTLTITLEFRII